MDYVCARSGQDVRTIAGAPGAVSVWGEQLMTPALDRSVPTAFNGDPNAIWSVEGVTGDGIGIAVIDTGIDATHPDLQMGSKTKMNTQVLFSAHDWQDGNLDPCPPVVVEQPAEDSETTSGHGTHLASVAAGDGTASAGKYKGMAPGADLYGWNVVEPISLRRQFGEGARISMLRVVGVLKNLLMMVGHEEAPLPIKVFLMGWTAPGLHEPDHPINNEIANLSYYNVSIVMPAGNEGPTASDCSARETCFINNFSANPHVITVGATPSRSRTYLESYSGRGDPATHEHSTYPMRYLPELVAPGSDVTAAKRVGLTGLMTTPSDHPLGASGAKGRSLTHPDYQALTGTSVAAAHVAGAIALMQEAALDAKGCYLTLSQVRQILRDTSTPMQGYGAWEVGAGALDATAAVWAARFAPKISSRYAYDCPPPA